MAQPIELETPVRDSRATLQARLENAPLEHADALLAAYDVLEGLHEHGVLDVARGLLGSSDKVLEIAVDAARSPESTRGIRNLVLLIHMLGAIDPAALKAITQTVPEVLQSVVQHPEPVGLWRLLKDFLWNRDFRRGLAAVNTLLSAIGRNLGRK